MSLPMGEIRSAFHYKILKSCSRKETISVFRWQKIFICNSICEKRFTIAFGVTDFLDADKRLCADHPRANVFPRTAVVKLLGLSITDAGWCMPARKAGAISGSENKFKLSSTSSIACERSSRSSDQCAPRIKQNSIWKHLWTTIC